MSFKHNKPTFWFWILQLFSTIKLWIHSLFFYTQTTPDKLKINLSSLPGELIGHIASFLESPEFLNGVIIPKVSIWSLFSNKVLHDNQISVRELYFKLKDSGFLFVEQIKFFDKLISNSGYLYQIESFLNHQKNLIDAGKASYESIHQLVSNKTKTIDMNGENITISAYAYTFFSYQKQKNIILDKYIDIDTKIKVDKECKIIQSYDLKRQVEEDYATQIMLAQSL